MGKISPPSIKYIIHGKFVADGVVEKPDIIGAIFGQTEGLLGEELELRELQKRGKIGRIDVTCETKESKTFGTIEIPTSIDKAETTIIAAAIETIDRIGPCSAKFEIENIEDIRSIKREYVMERAKKLLAQLEATVPEFKELEHSIVAKARASRIIEYGPEKLPAGPAIEKSKKIIVVEGRADVLNMLSYGIKNVIAINGTVIPDSIKKLSKQKEIILFVDGDRGGILIVKEAIMNMNVTSIAQAPDGKEVEELTEKEILGCLRNKITAEEFIKKRRIKLKKKIERKTKRKKAEKISVKEPIEKVTETEEEREFFQDTLNELTGTRGAAFVVKTKEGLKIIYKVPSSKIIDSLYNFKKRYKSLYALIIDGIATGPIIKTAEKLKCKFLVARNFANIKTRIQLISL